MKFTWLKIFIAYLIVQPFLITPLQTNNLTDQLIISLWPYKPMFFVFVYYLFFQCLLKINWNHSKRLIVLKTFLWVGTISACYVIMQYSNLDDRQNLMGVYEFQAARDPSDRLAAFMTHPNYAGSFIALCLPAAMYFKDGFKIALMSFAVLLTSSAFSILSMVVGIFIFLVGSGTIAWPRKPDHFIWICILGFLSLVGAWWAYQHYPHFLSSNGRFNIWTMMIQDWKQSPIFGFGFGSFSILFQSVHGVIFAEAHNEWIQLLYETGVVGVFLFIMFVKECFLKVMSKKIDKINIAFLSSFATIMTSSLGMFVWQIEPHRFYTVVLLAIMISKKGGLSDEKEISSVSSNVFVGFIRSCYLRGSILSRSFNQTK